MDLGFDGASMGEIARAAGVSKGTLYVYFADKNRLFEAIVEEEALEQGKVAFNFDPERDVATTLRDFGQAYIQLLCRPGGGSAIRTVMAIAERMPDVGRRYYEHVLEKTINRLADYLERACRANGDLAIDDCQLAASQFMHDVPGVAVPAVHLSGRARRPRPSASRKWSKARRGCFWRRIRRSGLERRASPNSPHSTIASRQHGEAYFALKAHARSIMPSRMLGEMDSGLDAHASLPE